MQKTFPQEPAPLPGEMTLQEAAVVCGRDLGTVRNWIKKQPTLARFDRAARRYFISKSALVTLWIDRWGPETLPDGLRD
jgi:hypothetical protein